MASATLFSYAGGGARGQDTQKERDGFLSKRL